MNINIESLREAFNKLAYELYKIISQLFSSYWEQIKELSAKYMEYKLERPERPVYGYVKHKVIRSQVMYRKPICVRARMVC
ncbi:hypothetical protein [Bacillus pseudomycoides]|uniref:hypothetical protein n=1 Tax=Bacillus pseudomycoides TaxID=64104 RepID=UPI000BF18547|nr:hypothetical protein [Bacillus pseudomycoides]PEM37308.1 hypothetical protein CN634_16985 [Bacillus pseudomycoides]PGE05673.1 hypothetical protein COM49_03185 [Bacillus pseudomycoides]PHG25882.1 hypothetical protein COI47_03330 [Bacillus pseudomycoides]